MFWFKLYGKQWQKIAWAALVGMLCLILAPGVMAAGKMGVRVKRKLKPLPQVDVSKLIWPLPPQVTRIRFLSQETGERDLAGVKMKKAGWLEKAAGVAVTNADLPKLKKPYGVAVDSKGLVYVADEQEHKIFVFDLEKKQLTYRGDKPPASFQLPMGLVIDDADRLFVSDAMSHSVTCLNANGEFVGVFGNDKLTRPVGLAVDNDMRRLYVADVKGSRIAIFDLDTFKFLSYINSQKQFAGESQGLLGTPTNLAVNPDGLLYVVDTISNRIEVFDTDGNYVRGFGAQGNTPGTFARPKGIAIDSDGHVYVADDEFNNFQIFTPEGQFLMTVGSFGPLPGQFMLLTGLTFDTQNRLVATDAGPLARIETFHYVPDAEADAEAQAAAAKVEKKPPN